MRRFSRFLASFAVMSCLLGPVFAQDGALRPLPELSQNFDLQAYASQTETITKRAENLGNISFQISLPNTWVERTALGQDYGELFRFTGPAFGDVRPYFSFRREQMKRENTAKGELVAHMLKSGYVLRGLKEIDARNVEAFYVKLDSNRDSYAIRARVRVQGDSLLMAEYAVPVHAFDVAADAQTYAIESFEFLSDSDAPVERRVRRIYHEVLKFSYPASWQFENEEVLGDNAALFELYNPGLHNMRNGVIRIQLYSGRHLSLPESRQRYPVSVPDLLRDIRARYEAERLIIGPNLENKQPDLGVKTKYASLDVYPVRRRVTDYETLRQEAVSQELWVALFQTDEQFPRTFLVEMITPAREQNVYVWSVNTRAFDLILQSIE